MDCVREAHCHKEKARALLPGLWFGLSFVVTLHAGELGKHLKLFGHEFIGFIQ